MLYRLADLGDDRVAVWMEDVPVDSAPWDVARFAQAAELLGTLAANRRDDALLSASPRPPGYGLRRYADGPARGAIEVISEPATRHHPALAGYASLQPGLLGLAERIPALLDLLDTLPQAMPHGDASPQNLLVPPGEPGTLIAIDIAFQTPHAGAAERKRPAQLGEASPRDAGTVRIAQARLSPGLPGRAPTGRASRPCA